MLNPNEIELKTKNYRFVLCYGCKFIWFDFLPYSNKPTNKRVSYFATIIHFLTLRLYIYYY